jgi:peptidoglycan/xylan/chitin deacetylase (PgdA/CDA1 family)
MPATFILSFDCEGRWGVADELTPSIRRQLTDDRLADAYATILGILEEFEVPATFAFVGAFAESREGFAVIRPELEQLTAEAPAYLGPALRDIDEAGGAGWHGGRLVEGVLAATAEHEVALHGITHVPWTTVGRSFAEAEMRLLQRLPGAIRNSRTFVYPRNAVAHVEVLAEQGFDGFRSARPQRSRAASLLSEFNLFERPEAEILRDSIVEIPAGYFLNWRHGFRRIVPPALTLWRARRLLDAAAAAGKVVHYWLHPENIVIAPSTLELLGALVREVAKRREDGSCEIMTQVGYCRSIESRSQPRRG